MFGLSLIEFVFHEFNKTDVTIESLLTITDLISKLTLICIDHDDVEKFRTISIVLKSNWVLSTMKSISYKVDHCTNINEIDLKSIDLFLLEEIGFIEYHLNELEKYFHSNCNIKEIICKFRRQIVFIKKPIQRGVYDIWGSYVLTFANEILTFKDVLIDLSPPFIYQLSHCLNNWYDNTSRVEIDKRNLNFISFKQLRLAIGNTSADKNGLLAIHQLIKSSSVEDKINMCTALRNVGSLGVEPDLVQKIKDSLRNYHNLRWLCDDNISCWKCVMSEVRPDNNSNISNSISDNLDDNNSVREDKIGHKDEKDNSYSLSSLSRSNEGEGEEEKDCIVTGAKKICQKKKITENAEIIIVNEDQESGLCKVVKRNRKKPKVSREPQCGSTSSNIKIKNKDKEENRKYSRVGLLDEVVQEGRRTRSMDSLESKEIILAARSSLEGKRRRLLPIDSAPVGLDRSNRDDATVEVGMLADKESVDNVEENNNNVNNDDCGAEETVLAASKRRRNNWSMEETYLVYRGVMKNMIWSTIKSAFFRNSSRTNVHIKDRWRVVNANKELKKTLQQMFENDKD